MDSLDELMDALAENAGIEGGFSPDEDGVVRVGYDDLQLSFMEIPGERTVLLWSPVGQLPEEGADAVKTGLLRANFMGRGVKGGVLSLSDDGGVVLHRMLPLAPLDTAGFIETVERFVATLADWAKALAEYDPNEAASAKDELDAGDAFRFLRV